MQRFIGRAPRQTLNVRGQAWPPKMHVSEKVGVGLASADVVHQPGYDDDDDDVLVEDGRKGSQWLPQT
eukprot:11173459-Lingulodinium_polyedra.AAC.1